MSIYRKKASKIDRIHQEIIIDDVLGREQLDKVVGGGDKASGVDNLLTGLILQPSEDIEPTRVVGRIRTIFSYRTKL